MIKNVCRVPPGQALWGKPRIPLMSVWHPKMGGDTESPQARPGLDHPQVPRPGELTGQKRDQYILKELGGLNLILPSPECCWKSGTAGQPCPWLPVSVGWSPRLSLTPMSLCLAYRVI